MEEYFTNLDFLEIKGFSLLSYQKFVGGPKTRVFGRKLIWPE